MADAPFWTFEEMTVLRHMHASGDSFSRIGKVLDRPRAGCISKARKLGLPRRRTGRQVQRTITPIHIVVSEFHPE